MSEYTPTISELRAAWLSAEFEERDSTTSDDDLRAEFDRALAAHDAEVRATTLAEALCTEAHPWELLDFREAWEAADARFEVGSRVRQGLAAMLNRRARLLAERLEAGVVAEEPEWEYGYELIESDTRDVLTRSGAFESEEAARHWAQKAHADEGDPEYPPLVVLIVRRRKAGPWVPVKQEGASNDG